MAVPESLSPLFPPSPRLKVDASARPLAYFGQQIPKAFSLGFWPLVSVLSSAIALSMGLASVYAPFQISSTLPVLGDFTLVGAGIMGLGLTLVGILCLLISLDDLVLGTALGGNPQAQLGNALMPLALAGLLLSPGPAGRFLFWEAASVLGLLVLADNARREDARQALTGYFIQMQIGAALLLSAWMLNAYGPIGFANPVRLGLILLTIGAFSAKLGLVPFHSWMPATYAHSRGHATAYMSGPVKTAFGFAMLFLVQSLEQDIRHTGLALIILGVITMVYGAFFSARQQNALRSLAYSTVDNMGVAVMGMGIWLIGKNTNNEVMQALAFSGTVLHLALHGFFKTAALLLAERVRYITSSYNLDRQGGLAKAYPGMTALAVINSISATNLPPLGGFVAEWLLALALVKGLTATQVSLEIILLIALSALALTGGLGIMAYVRQVGLGMLGQNRNPAAFKAHLNQRWVLVACCMAVPIAAGLAPAQVIIRLVGPAAYAAIGPEFLATLPIIGGLNAALIAISLLILIWRVNAVSARGVTQSPVWGCGYTAGNFEHQYTASGFGQPLDDVLPLSGQSQLEGATERFPKRRRFVWNDVDGLSQRIIGPAYQSVGKVGSLLHKVTGPQPLQKYISFAIWFIITFLALTAVGIL